MCEDYTDKYKFFIKLNNNNYLFVLNFIELVSYNLRNVKSLSTLSI